ncbi:FHA domain-containing protein [Deinococcus cellulosilyticus]|uniref:FraH-like protein n=1 Tax=Deinococcus cellulosilyticus (strain DSM 18568 / NBRC 106333 / KACC 11606 / 5516J-15) TaxID=1223518 RepID=A0A511N939_DEIC1|nr:FHA domain-containing protein [Deinococcus cellulosilyticus]GEM49365.1 FraH-like protein [Deinococcus cellulosilyticus NBRC 106333 = KACC 11606]
MIVCQVCGTQNPDGARFCDGCGVELAATPSTPSPEVRDTPLPENSTWDSNVVPPTPPLNQPDIQEPISQNDPLAGSSTPVPTPEVVEEPLEDVQPSTPVQESASGPITPDSTDQATPASETVSEPLSEPVSMNKSEPAPEVAPEPTPEPTPVETPAAPSAPASGGLVPAKLAIKKYGVLSGDSIPLAAGALTVGRFDASTGPVDIDVTGLPGSEHVSRRHAQVFFENGQWKVKDLGSTNGVFVRKSGEVNFGPRIAEPTALTNGDEIAFGNLLMIFQED